MEELRNELTGCAVFAAAPSSQPVNSEADLVPAALAESHGDYATSEGATGLRSSGFSAFSLQFAQAAGSITSSTLIQYLADRAHLPQKTGAFNNN